MATTPRDASTVLPLRDGTDGLEVFMVKRSSALGFLGGHHVFPGGAVDEQDADPAFEELLEGFDAAECVRRFGMTDRVRARAHVVAAIRELFEESGILLASGDVTRSAGTEQDRTHRRQAARARIAGGELAFARFLAEEGLRLQAGDLRYFAHWITPKSGEKRFDTRFFVVRMPEGQSARHDRHESIEGEWVQPRAALERYARREIELVPPTICSLDRLALHGSVEEVLEAARTLDVVTVIPRITLLDGTVTILYPGDADYDSGVARSAEGGKMLNRLVLRDGIWVRP